MAYSVVPALDEFGLGYGDLGDLGDYSGPRHKLGPKGKRALRRFRRRMRRATAAKRRRTLQRLRARQRNIKARVARGGNLRKRRYALLVRKIKSLRRIMRRPIRSLARPPLPPRYRRLKPTVTAYRPIRPRVANYAPIRPPQQAYAPIDTATSVYAPIQPAVQQYGPVPMASEPGASASSVVRIRQTAGSQAPVEVDFEEEDFELETGADPDAAAAAAEDAEDAMDGYGSYGKIFAGKFGGVVATKNNYIRLRKRYFKLRRKSKKSKVFRGPMRAAYKKLRNIEKKNAFQIRRRKSKGKKPRPFQSRLRKYINKVGGIRSKLASIKRAGKGAPPPPPRKGAPPPPPKAGETFAQYKARMKRGGWRTPPSDFLSKSKRGRFRWRMWNRNTPTARRYRSMYFARKRRVLGPPRLPRYMPIPRPVPQYTPIRPYVPQYAPIRTPGPMFAPIVPPMQQYAPAPRPIPRTYAPVGTESPYSYTYTTAPAQAGLSQAATAAARRAVQQAEVVSEVADDAEGDEQEGIGLGKIALGIGIVGAGAYFISKGKKGKKGKKKPANGRA